MASVLHSANASTYNHKTRSMTMALPIWGILGGMTALFFSALFLRGQKMLEPRRAVFRRNGTK